MVGSVCFGCSPVNGTLLDLGGVNGGAVLVLTVLVLSSILHDQQIVAPLLHQF